MLLNMDNAGNCDTTAEELETWLSDFRGKKWRLRCLLHILNLIAKVRHMLCTLARSHACRQVILAFFYKPPKKKSAARQLLQR